MRVYGVYEVDRVYGVDRVYVLRSVEQGFSIF